MELSHVVIYFFGYAILGYVCEVLYCSIGERRLVNRGFLHGPYLPVYGIGALVAYSVLHRFKTYPILVFLAGLVVCSIVEFFTGWILEKLFHAKLWDYSSRKVNIQGRVCLLNSVLFGLLSLAVIYILQPRFSIAVQQLPARLTGVSATVILVLISVDTTVSVQRMINFHTLLQKAKELRLDWEERLERIGEQFVPSSTAYIEKELEHVRTQLRTAGRRILDAFPGFTPKNLEQQILQVQASIIQWRAQRKASRKNKAEKKRNDNE